MNILSMFAFFSAMFALFQGFFVIYLNRRSAIHWLFFFLTLCLAYWSFCAVFGYSADSIDGVFFWLRMSAPGYTLLHAVTLHFIMEVTGFSRKLHRFIVPALYIPSFFFTWYGATHHFVFDMFTRVDTYWIGRPMLDSPLFVVFMLQYLSYYTAAALIIVWWMRRRNSKRIRKQGTILLVSICGTILIYNLESLLLPHFTDYRTLVVSVNAGIIWVTGFWIAIIRFHMFTWETDRLLNEIFNELDQFIVLLDADLSLIVGNQTAVQLFDYKNHKFGIPGLENTVNSHLNRKNVFESARTCQFFSRIRDINGLEHSYRFTMSAKLDTYGDFYGYLLTGKEVKEFESLKLQYHLTDREMGIVYDLCNGLSGRDIAEKNSISLATVKSHCTHIYNKIGTNNRLELMKLLNDYSADLSSEEGLLLNRR